MWAFRVDFFLFWSIIFLRTISEWLNLLTRQTAQTDAQKMRDLINNTGRDEETNQPSTPNLFTIINKCCYLLWWGGKKQQKNTQTALTLVTITSNIFLWFCFVSYFFFHKSSYFILIPQLLDVIASWDINTKNESVCLFVLHNKSQIQYGLIFSIWLIKSILIVQCQVYSRPLGLMMCVFIYWDHLHEHSKNI